MDDEELWALEEAFWTGGVGAFEERIDPACLMVFPAPAGVLDAARAREGLKGAPRWRKLAMEERRLARPADALAFLAYRAEADRGDGALYRAYCGSAYRREGERWLLFSHQQTPA